MEYNIELIATDNKIYESTESIYSVAGFSLDVQLLKQAAAQSFSDSLNDSFEKRTNNILLIFDSLTLTFDTKTRLLTTIDSYTNKEKWIKKTIKKKEALTNHALFLKSFTSERMAVNCAPIYFFDEKNQILEIQILEAKDQNYFEISPHFFVGEADGKLTSLIIEQLVFL